MEIKKFSDAWKIAGTKHDWVWARKRPVMVRAIKIESEFSIETLEGVMTGHPGDYLIEGVKGELYPCNAEIFKEIYIIVNGGE